MCIIGVQFACLEFYLYICITTEFTSVIFWFSILLEWVSSLVFRSKNESLRVSETFFVVSISPQKVFQVWNKIKNQYNTILDLFNDTVDIYQHFLKIFNENRIFFNEIYYLCSVNDLVLSNLEVKQTVPLPQTPGGGNCLIIKYLHHFIKR